MLEQDTVLQCTNAFVTLASVNIESLVHPIFQIYMQSFNYQVCDWQSLNQKQLTNKSLNQVKVE